MRKLLTSRWLYWLLGIVALLGIAALVGYWWLMSWAHERVEDELRTRVESVGWTLESADVEVTRHGEVTVRNLLATGPHGGRVEVAEITTALDPRDYYHGKRIPDAVAVRGVEVYVSRRGLEAAQRARSSGGDESASGGGGGAFPTIDVRDARITVATETELGIVRLDESQLHVERTGADEERAWLVEGDGIAERDGRHPVDFSFTWLPGRRWGSALVDFADPLSLHVAGVGTASIGHVELAGSPESLAGNLAEIEVIPEFFPGLERVGVERVDLSLSTASGRWWPESLRVVGPSATVDLAALLAGPVGRRYPRAVGLANAAAMHVTGAPIVAPERLRDQRRQSDRRGRASAGGPGSGTALARLDPTGTAPTDPRTLLEQLPGILVEDGSLELRIGPARALRLRGIGFDTNQLGGATTDGRDYALSVQLRGATADIAVHVPDEPGTWPTGSIRIRDLTLVDLFTVADLPPPAELGGTVDFDLAVARGEAGEALVTGGVAVKGGSFFHPKISSVAITEIDASATGTLRYDPARDHLLLDDVALTSGPITVQMKATVDAVRTDPVIAVEFWADAMHCEDIPGAFPPGSLPTITDLRVAPGRIDPRISIALEWNRPRTFELEVENFPTGCQPLSVAPHDVLALNEPDYTKTYYEYVTAPITVGPGTSDWVDLDELPGFAMASMYLTEDKRFYDHDGLRLGLIERAVKLNLEHGRYVYGGSSISQQLVKNLFLTRTKTLARKLEEILIVWTMEWEVPKDRILALYLNCIEFGPDVYGIEQGARFYFDKPAREMTSLEVGYLASLKVKPVRGGKFFVKSFPGWGRWWHKRQRYIQFTLAENGYIAPIQAMAGYPYMPPFVHPDPDDFSDPRNAWMNRHAATVDDL